MQVILLEKIHRLGNLGDQVKVKSGYGRNYLIPQGKAVSATPDNIKKFEARRAELEQVQAEALARAQARAEQINQLALTLTRKAGPEGKLFGSVGTVDIAEAVTQAGVQIAKQEIRLPHGSIRTVGEHEIDIHLHADVEAKIKITIMAEEEKH